MHRLSGARRVTNRIVPDKPDSMIVLGLVLLLIGFLTGIWIIWVLGVIALVLGLLGLAFGMFGHPVAGRRHSY